MLSPLQLDDFTLNELHIARGIAGTSGADSPTSIEYTIEVGYDVSKAPATNRGRRHRVTLAVRIESAKPDEPCPIRLVTGQVTGMFSLPKRASEELVTVLVPANCLAILYGVLRGIVIQATGGCPGGCFIMPTLDIVGIVRSAQPGEKTTGTARATATPRLAKAPRRAKKAVRRGSPTSRKKAVRKR